MEPKLEKGERIDNIGFGNLRLIQKPEDFCYGVDAVLLAHFASKTGEQNKERKRKLKRGMDLGTGTGIVPLLLWHKMNIEEIFGLEMQKGAFERALRNMVMNGLMDRVKIIHGDVSTIINSIDKNLIGTFDLVTANPPYMKSDGAIKNENTAKMIARHETTGSLEDFIASAACLLKPRGDFYMVHRPSRLADIIVCCRAYHLEPKGIRFVAPKQGEKPNILLLHCIKNANPELKIMNTLIIYEGDDYSKEINEIYER